MGNVIYLLGAGASAEAIPVVASMAKNIKKDIQEIYDLASDIEDDRRTSYINHANYVNNVLTPLVEACEKYYSIDTYAKKLFLTNEEQFLQFKLDLSFYFTIRQFLKSPDKRYDNFWASILTEPNHIPGNIRILSWNYDFQLELSYQNMSTCASLRSAKSSLKINAPDNGGITPGFAVMKINGSATVFDSNRQESMYLCDYSSASFSKKIQYLIETHKMIKKEKKYKSELKFAWEIDPYKIYMNDFLFGV